MRSPLVPTDVFWPLNCIVFSVELNQSNPSYNPKPFVATAPCTCHFLPFNSTNPNASHTSAVVMQFLMSCLFAKTKIAELRMNGSLMMLLNSSLARLIRSRSNESTTKINPSVLLK